MVLTHTPDWTFWVTFAVLLGVPIALDFVTATRKRRLLRTTLWSLATVALALLYVAPQIPDLSREEDVFLITEGATPDFLDSLREAHPSARFSYSMAEIKEQAWEKIFVVGDGLEEGEWENISSTSQAYIPGKLPEGIVEILVGEALEGAPFDIQGRLSLEDSLELSLLSANGELQTQALSTEDTIFQWRIEEPIAGQWLYYLIGVRDGDTLFHETLPVEVKKPIDRKALLVAGAPSFELNALKNFLVTRSFAVASRVALSTDITQRDFWGMGPMRLGTLDSALFRHFRLLVIDESAYLQLQRTELQALQSAVRYGQLGLLVLSNSPDVLRAFGPVSSGRSSEEEVHWQGKKYPVTSSKTQAAGGTWAALETGQVVFHFIRRQGLGYVAFPSITDTYKLQLQGAGDVYGQVYARLFRRILGEESLDLLQEIPQRMTMGTRAQISVSQALPPELLMDNMKLPPINSAIRTDWWRTDIWPPNAGWHNLEIDGSTTPVYVHDTSSWVTQRTFEKQRLNRYMVQGASSARKITRFQPVNRWVFIVIFLLSMTGIWLERKFP